MSELNYVLKPPLAALKRWRWSALGIAWLLCLGGWAYVVMLPDHYEARALLYVEEEVLKSRVRDEDPFPHDPGAQARLMQQILRAEGQVGELIQIADLDLTGDASAGAAALVQSVQQSIRVEGDGPGRFAISFRHQDPYVAQRAVDAILQLLAAQNARRTQHDAAAGLAAIEREIVDHEVRLGAAELAIRRFRDRNQDAMPAVDERAQQAGRAKDELSRLQHDLERMLQQRDHLKRSMEPASGEARVRADQLAQLRRLEVMIGDLDRRVIGLQVEADPLTFRRAFLSGTEQRFFELTDRYSRLLSAYEHLVQQRELMRLAEELEADRYRIGYRLLDAPGVPLAPTGPPRGLMMVSVLVIGVCMGFSYAMLRQLLSNSFLTINQLKGAFDLPVLGGVAEARGQAGRRLATREWSGVVCGALALVCACALIFYLVEINVYRPETSDYQAGPRPSINQQIGMIM